MNDVLQNIMIFINDHTLLLIGICVFLILVLIGYLIDNSVKSKRVRKDIKNASQVPENIKDEIIKEASKDIKIQENIEQPIQNNLDNLNVNIQEDDVATIATNQLDLSETQNNNVGTSFQSNENNIPLDTKSDDLNASLNLDSNITLDLNDMPLESENLTAPLNIDISLDETPKSNSDIIPQDILADIVTKPSVDTDISIDPDVDIMKSLDTNLSEYTNDKKLSEILSGTNMKETKTYDDNIFTTSESNISINNDIKKDDVQIQSNTNEEEDELDKIMRKLSSMNNNTEEDNYTNIF